MPGVPRRVPRAERLVLEALFSIECLLRGAENELFVAVSANEGFILIHICILLKNRLTFTDWLSRPDFLLGREGESKEAVFELRNDG